jgi:hypothetical protein
MPEIDRELQNLLKESYEERALSKGHPIEDMANASEKSKKVEHARRLMGRETDKGPSTPSDRVTCFSFFSATTTKICK